MRTASKLMACAFSVLAGVQLQAQTNVLSDPVGFYKVNIVPGANFISAPMQKVHTYRGVVSSIPSASQVVFSNSPGFTVNQFAPVTLGGAGAFNQYILIVRSTAKGETYTNNLMTPPVVVTTTFVGDWWPITANTANSVTVAAGSDNLTTHLAVGDQLEIRKLTSLADLFGTGSSVILNKDNDGLPSATQEDVIRYVVGTGFTKEVIYYDGSLGGGEGYLVNGEGPYDGTQVTLDPDEPVMLFRKAGSPATNIVSLGQVQTTRLTHYFSPGANTFANVFPANSPIGTSNLKEAKGFVPDNDGLPSTSQEDILRRVLGTGFTDEGFLYGGDTTPTPPTWVVNGNENPTYPILPGAGYILFVKQGTGGRVWRQNVPFTP